jgi:hypothetical protein
VLAKRVRRKAAAKGIEKLSQMYLSAIKYSLK